MANLRLRVLQNKKTRTQVAKRAKKPKTVITAIAQWGKDELSVLPCTLPVGCIDCVEDESEPSRPVDEGDGVEDMVEVIESA